MFTAGVRAVFRFGARKAHLFNVLFTDAAIKGDKFLGNEACDKSKLRLRLGHKERVLERRYRDYYRSREKCPES